MIQEIWIQELGNGKLAYEESLVQQECERKKIPYRLFEESLEEESLIAKPETMVVGDLFCIREALGQLQILTPKDLSYPVPLNEYLHRKIWTSTLEEIEAQFTQNPQFSVFIKPLSEQKSFTGQVLESKKDLENVYWVDRQEKIWCSEVVDWLVEYRVYVVHSEIRAIGYSSGNSEVKLNPKILQHAVEKLSHSKSSISGYAIDFGMLRTGETALIEMNDGFALGAFGIESKDYMDLLSARWNELTQKGEDSV